MATIGSRYRVLDLLGAGGMGVVYRAADETLRRPVALKFLASTLVSDEEYRARFLREARIAASLNHPNTCVVYEVGELDYTVTIPDDDRVLVAGTPFIAMEFVEGDTLSARLERAGPLPVRIAIDIAVQLAEGLAEAHSHHILHRDLKPLNVMITRGGRVKIVDFGLAKPIRSVRVAQAEVSTSEMLSADMGDGGVIGTCAYMSPEQAAGKELNEGSDVFSFGTILFQMLTGGLPFAGDTANETMAKIIEADPAPWPQTAANAFSVFGYVVARCLRKRPAARYTDAGELLDDLREIYRSISSDVPIVSRWRRGAKRVRQASAFGVRRPVASVAVLLVAFVAPFLLTTTTDLPSVAPPQKPHINLGPLTLPDPSKLKPDPTETVRPVAPGPASVVPAGNITRTPIGADDIAVRSDVGALSLTSVPRASVNLDGSLTGVTPLTIEAALGTHEVILTGPDGLRWRGRIVVTAGEATVLHRDLNATGSLSVVSDVWYEVSLDDGSPEQTPIHFDHIATGLHKLRVFREGYVTRELEIVIEEGKASSHRITLERNP